MAEEAAAVVVAMMLLMITAMTSLSLRLVSHALQVIVLVFFVQWRMRLLPGWLQKAVDSVANQVDGSSMRGGAASFVDDAISCTMLCGVAPSYMPARSPW
jgi:hypothetical protein